MIPRFIPRNILALILMFGITNAIVACKTVSKETSSSKAAYPKSTHVWTNEEKRKALDIMVESSKRVSRTIKDGRRSLAPSKVGEDDISEISESNFRVTAENVLENMAELELTKKTAIALNKMLTVGLVPKKDWGNYLYRPRDAKYANQTDSFVDGDPEKLYKWLGSPAAVALFRSDPIALAEIVHNNIAALDSFPDGNGRLSRLMADLVLMKAGMAPASYTTMEEYFSRGTPRAPVSRAFRQQYFREIIQLGQKKLRL
ncbi:MAG: Fic family protein [Proteobacteria bacterium]|nr:Fic family protein [Pseudomonadota bacterium]